jgi:phage gp36-like protein
MTYAQTIALLPSSGYNRSGSGLPVRVGRNSSLALDVVVSNATADATTNITIETSSFAVRDRDRHAVTWRQLGNVVEFVGNGVQSVSLVGADAFVRASYAITGAPVSLSCEGLATRSLVASQSITTSGASPSINLAQYHGGRFVASVSAAPVGQTLTLSIERSSDGSKWETATTWTAIVTVGNYAIESADLDKFVRVRWVASGAGTWTFGVSGKLSLIFARTRDRSLLGIRSAAVPGVTAAKYLSAFESASDVIEGDLGAFVLPLVQWGDDMRRHCIAIADWFLLAGEGEEPQGGIYSTLYLQAQEWLQNVGGRVPGNHGRRIRPANVIDSTPPDANGTRAAYAFQSDPMRDSRSGCRRGVIY